MVEKQELAVMNKAGKIAKNSEIVADNQTLIRN